MGRASRRKKAKNSENDTLESKILSLIINDKYLSIPVYLHSLRTESDSKNYDGQLPLAYVWNEDRVHGTFSLSINGELLAGILELFCDRKDPEFVLKRDNLLKIFSTISNKTAVEQCSQFGAFPSEIFSRNPFEDINTVYQDWSHLRLAKEKIENSIKARDRKLVDQYLSTLFYLVSAINREHTLDILSDIMLNLDFGNFLWFQSVQFPDQDLPDENNPIFEDEVVCKFSRILIQEGLTFDKDFSFSEDKNGERQINFSEEGRKNMKPRTMKLLNEIQE